MRTKYFLFILCGFAALSVFAGCSDDTSGPDSGGDGIVTDTLVRGTNGIDVTVKPASNNTVYLKGYYLVNPGTKLTIPAGTKVVGLPESIGGEPAAIITERGTSSDKPSGQLIADGTKDNPIVFTSSYPKGQRHRSDWGGIILLGNANNNIQNGSGVVEGTGGDFGWAGALSEPKNNDNSGIIRYVRIEFGGTKVSSDNEINGLTFGAVGSGTTIDYVQSHFIADDGYEWFGGTVNVKHLISSGNDDDAFDMDNGYQGNLQFLFGMQDPDLANRGYEVDNDADGSTKMPFTASTSANVTLVGTGKDKANDDNNDGFYLRRSCQLKIWNAIVTNFRYAMVVDGPHTGDYANGGQLYVKQSILNGRTGTYFSKDAADYSATAASWDNIEEDPQLVGIDFTNPQPRPTNPKAANVGSVPSNGFFEPNSYAGAFDPASSSYWFEGWTTWDKN